MKEAGLESSRFFTEQGDTDKLSSVLLKKPHFTEVFVLGGDGTLNYVVNEIQDRDLPISIISNGTGNDSVKSLHGELNFQKQVEIASAWAIVCAVLSFGWFNLKPVVPDGVMVAQQILDLLV